MTKAGASLPRPTRARKTDGRTHAIQIRAALARDILAGRFHPGTRLSEEHLSQFYGVSRTPVREALKLLSSEGLVELRPHQGAVIAQMSVSAVMEMFEVMSLLEADCAALAARRHTASDRDALVLAHDACKSAARDNDPEAFYDANARFHEAIYRASHNGLLESQTIMLRNRVEAYRRETTFHAGLMALSIAEHERILKSVLAMDESAARDSMQAHLDTLRNDAIAVVEAASKHSRKPRLRLRGTSQRDLDAVRLTTT